MGGHGHHPAALHGACGHQFPAVAGPHPAHSCLREAAQEVHSGGHPAAPQRSFPDHELHGDPLPRPREHQWAPRVGEFAHEAPPRRDGAEAHRARGRSADAHAGDLCLALHPQLCLFDQRQLAFAGAAAHRPRARAERRQDGPGVRGGRGSMGFRLGLLVRLDHQHLHHRHLREHGRAQRAALHGGVLHAPAHRGQVQPHPQDLLARPRHRD
mmetsp:Transcript_41574/g.132267  ORF Transcript_41574/g.132267 Transcript_41574/m.132267 type:complete len:212 (-) Transcript_41574:647-1282(-)